MKNYVIYYYSFHPVYMNGFDAHWFMDNKYQQGITPHSIKDNGDRIVIVYI
jgi:hypothetical protein